MVNVSMSSKTVPIRVVVDTGDRLRKDDGKSRMDLIPPEMPEALGQLYRRGAEKYSPRGWEEGMSWGRCFASLLRHAFKWARGEDYDSETGAHHMIAVVWNATALYVYHVRNKGTDDRGK